MSATEEEAAAGPASTGDAIRLERRIAAPPEAVFGLLIEPEKLVGWMGIEADIDPRPGGRFHLNITGSDIAEGEYVEVDRPSRVSFTWGWVGSDEVPPGSSTVVIELRPDGDGTMVSLIHHGLPGGDDDSHREGWTHYFERLVVFGVGDDPGPDGYVQDDARETDDDDL